MYSHERTMLAKLGFADPDHREPLHDFACQYLATPDAVRRLIKYLGLEHQPRPEHHQAYRDEQSSMVSRTVAAHRAALECEISKGYGQYRTTIGFADMTIRFIVEERHSQVKQRLRDQPDGHGGREWSAWRSIEDYAVRTDLVYGVEVKVKPQTIGAVLRQVKLYRSYSHIANWLLATAYNASSSDIACLRNEQIVHIRLGARFEAYVASRQADVEASNVEV